MAHKSISDLAPLVSAADGDMLVVVDVSDTSMSVAGTTKKATRAVLLNGVLTANQTITLSGDVAGSGTTAITATLATVPIAKGGTGQVTAADAFTALKQAATTSATGVVELATDGESAANLAVQANDARLSNARTPTAHVHAAADVSSGTLDIARLPVASSGVVDTTKVVRSDDQRLSDARTPTTHNHNDLYYTESEADALLAAKAASVHTHAASDTTSGTFDIARIPVASSGTSNATQVPRADDSRLSNSRTPNGAASGDLSGTYPSPVVAKIQGRSVASTAPTNGQAIVWNNSLSRWEPGTAAAGGSNATQIQSVNVSATTPTNTQALRYNSSNVQWEPTSLGTAAAQDTSTATFNASQIQSVNVSATTPANTQALRYNASNTQWEPATLGTAAGQDTATATFNASQIQSVNVSSTTPTDAQALRYNSSNTQWEPTSLGTAAAQDTASAVFNASQIQSVNVSATTPTNTQALRYNSSNTQWEPTSLGTAAAQDVASAVFNASQIQSVAVSATAPTSGQVLQYNSGNSQWEPATAGGGDLLAANNLSDVASASTSRTNLGLAIGTNVQAYNANTAFLNVAQSWSAAQRGTISTLTDGATITPNFNTANNYTVTLAGNRTLANPTNVTAGQSGSIFILQDGTGSRTLAYGANWDFAGGSAPVLSTAASSIDRLDYIARSSTSIHAVLTKAYA